MTTRKHGGGPLPQFLALAALGWLALGGAGCATPGPLHVYSLATAGDERTVRDTGDGRTTDVPSFLEPDEVVSGFAYDPFTDHFFLRLDPGNRIRVVDRPARAIKREFDIEGKPEIGGGDLAVRPRDGHLFLLKASSSEVLETSRLGKTVRAFALAGVSVAPVAIAIDPLRDRLLILNADARHITVHDLQGARTADITLAEPAGSSLAYDPEKREMYAPLRNRPGQIGVFDEAGKLLRSEPSAGPLMDVGVRSFVRVF